MESSKHSNFVGKCVSPEPARDQVLATFFLYLHWFQRIFREVQTQLSMQCTERTVGEEFKIPSEHDIYERESQCMWGYVQGRLEFPYSS